MAPRVAHIIPTDRIAYYMQRVRLQFLRRAGFEVTVICGQSRTGLPANGSSGTKGAETATISYGEELERCGLEVVYIPFAREIAPLVDLRCAAQMLTQIRGGEFDIIHSHNPKGGLLTPPVAQLAGARAVIHTVHGFLFNDNTHGLHHALALAAERWTASWCDHLLFQSEEDFDFARHHGFKREEQLHLIGNGIDEERFSPQKYPGARERLRLEFGWDSTHLVVGAVGRLVAEKGFFEFFAMAERLAADFPEVRFLVVGISEEDQSDALNPRSLIERHGLSGRCVVLERRRDMPELYLAMDLLIHPSHREGLSRALLEASGMGTAIVAGDIRGSREVIEDGVTGLLAPTKDVPAFVAAAKRLLADPALREVVGGRARQRVLEQFTEARTAARITRCYEEILDLTPS